jgi:hypothetical protein
MGVELAMSSSAIDGLVEIITSKHEQERFVSVRFVGPKNYEVSIGDDKAVGRSIYTALRNLDKVCRARRGEKL